MITATDGTTKSGIEIASCEYSKSTNEDDGSAPGVDKCFLGGGDCASCCGGCVKTTDLDNKAKELEGVLDSCVCYEADTAPPDTSYGTEKNDCVFIKANYVRFIQVRNQCLEEARRKCSLRRGEEVDARDASRACGRDSDLISSIVVGK